jgi:hypothetical protein
VLFVSLLFQIATGIWYLVTFYTTRNKSIYDCLDGTTNQTKIDYCNAIQVYKKYPQGYILATVIVPIVIQLCEFPPDHHRSMSYKRRTDACHVVHSYSRYLEREAAEKHRHNRLPGAVYQPVHRHDEHYPLTHSTNYPYADAPNSFGNKV